MSNHCPRKAIDRHHTQVNEGRSRREQRQDDRHLKYLAMREEGLMEYHLMMVLSFGGFAYIMFVTAVYLKYLLDVTLLW